MKNLAMLAGKPLLEYAIDAARASGAVADVVVSSDSEAILEAARHAGARALLRPAQFATDTASSDSVIAHCIDELHLREQPEQAIVLLQPTSPLRTPAHVAQAIELWRSSSAQAVIGVFEPDHHPAKSFRLGEDGMLSALFDADAPFTPRQALPRAFQPNGAVYVFSVAAFLLRNRIPRESLAPLLMQRRESLDIDCAEDLLCAARFLEGSTDG